MGTASWIADDKIMTRDSFLPFLRFATFNGKEFVGGLMSDQLRPSLGYKVCRSGYKPATLTQTGLPQLPVEDVVLRIGWNWIGHAPLDSFAISCIEAIAPFYMDDEIKTRAGSNLKVTTYTGGSSPSWQGNIGHLRPGIGYKFKVSRGFSFSYNKSCNLGL